MQKWMRPTWTDDALDLGGFGYIRRGADGADFVRLSNLFRRGGGFIGVAGTDNNIGADAGEGVGHLQAEPFGTAGNPGGFAVKFEEFKTHDLRWEPGQLEREPGAMSTAGRCGCDLKRRSLA